MAKKHFKPSYLAETYKDMSFADAAEKISKKYSKRGTDLIQKQSFELEMMELSKLQEMQRMEEEGIELNDSRLPQHAKGDFIRPLTQSLISALGNVPIGDVPLAENPWKGVTQKPSDVENISVPPGKNPWSGLPTIPTTPQQPTMYGTRPETIASFVKSQMTPQQTYDDKLGTGTTDRSTSLFGDNPLVINNSQGMSTSSDAPKTGAEASAYLPAYIGQGLSTALNLGILAGGYGKEAPVDNPYEQEVKRLSNQSIDTTQQRNQILSSYNAALQNIDNTRSANVRNALQSNLASGTADVMAQSKLAEQQANLNLKQNYANTLNQLGMQKAQAQQMAEELTARNKGNWQSNLSALGANLAQSGEFFTTKTLNDNQNKLLGDILSSKHANVGLNPDLWLRMKQGKPTPADISIIKATYGEVEGENIIKSFNADDLP